VAGLQVPKDVVAGADNIIAVPYVDAGGGVEGRVALDFGPDEELDASGGSGRASEGEREAGLGDLSGATRLDSSRPLLQTVTGTMPIVFRESGP
jgi:hypothetical protein